MRFSKVNKLILETVALLLLLSAGCLNAQAEEINSLEIRGAVYSGMNLEEILVNEGGQLEMNALNFPAFYYDVDDDISTESLVICDGNGRTIWEDSLIYSTCINFVEFAYQDAAWTDENGNTISNYPLLALFGEPYVPLDSNSPDKLVPLLLDDDDKYTLRTGEIIDLGEGYRLEAKQVDVDGNRVWLEFSKDGEYVDDENIFISSDSSQSVWQVDVDDVEGENDVIVLRVHVNQVFQGAVDSIAQLEGLWLIDYENATSLENDMEYGEFEVSLLGDSLEFTNPDSIYLEMDSEQEITEELAFVVADDPEQLRFYVMRKYDEPGTYEIRGEVVQNVTEFEWDYSNFPAFFYEIDENLYSETLSIEGLEARTIPEEGLIYTTEIIFVDYEYGNWNYDNDDEGGQYIGGYPMEVLFGEPFVTLDPQNADKLAYLLLDDDEEYRIKNGDALDLGSGYGLEVKQVDVDGYKVWLEFTKDGEFVDDEVIDLSYEDSWDVELDDIEGEDDVLVMKVNVENVYHDGDYYFVEIGALWLIDYENAFTIESGDEFGNLEAVSISDCLVFENINPLNLEMDDTVEIAEYMYFRVADNNTLRFYPFIEKTFAGCGSSSGSGSSGGNWISWDDPESDGGTKITTAELQQIIYYWLNDLAVHPEEE